MFSGILKEQETNRIAQYLTSRIKKGDLTEDKMDRTVRIRAVLSGYAIKSWFVHGYDKHGDITITLGSWVNEPKSIVDYLVSHLEKEAAGMTT